MLPQGNASRKSRGDAKKEAARIEGEAKKDIAAAKLETERLHKQNLDTESRLEAERKERRELEKSFGFRWLTKSTDSDIEPLKRFTGMYAVIQSATDQEPTIASAQLANALVRAGWKVDIQQMFGSSPTDILDGLIVAPVAWVPLMGAPPKTPLDQLARTTKHGEQRAAEKMSDEAASAVLTFLATNGWDARQSVQWSEEPSTRDAPLSAVTIKIGIKPNMYFFPEPLRAEIQHSLDVRHRVDEEMKQRRERAEREMKEFEERLRERQKPPLVLRPPEEHKKPD